MGAVRRAVRTARFSADKIVIPAKAGIQWSRQFGNLNSANWIPAFAGMTVVVVAFVPYRSSSASAWWVMWSPMKVLMK